jgi:succinoglycan biosynthesis protein ExoM
VTDTTKVGVYVCTYRRNEALTRLLESLEVAAKEAADVARVGVAVIDDNDDGRARAVADEFTGRFPGGVTYRHTGSGNISVARNAGLEAAMEGTDWVAMTDDDAVVPPDWIVTMLRVQAETGADAITGSTLLRYPPGSPRWLNDQPFCDVGILAFEDRSESPLGSTCNSMLRSSFLREHPDIRFEPALGTLGGEDGVFYRRAINAGLRVVYSSEVSVFGEEPPERCSFRYQVRRAIWLGNSEGVVNLQSGAATRGRLVLRAGRRFVHALERPARRMARRQGPHLRFTAAQSAEVLGMVLSAAGVHLEHP